MTDQTDFTYRVYTVINPTDATVTRSVRGANSPYRSPFTVHYDATRYQDYSFDTSKREWILIYKRVIGETFIEPAGEYVKRLNSGTPYEHETAERYLHYYVRGNSVDQKPDSWNYIEIRETCKSILNDVIFNEASYRGPISRFHTERILYHMIEIAQENDITALHYAAYWTWYYGGLTESQKQNNFTWATYNGIDQRCKAITKQYPWLDATTWESEHGNSSGNSGGASGNARDPVLSMIDNPDYVRDFGTPQ